MSSDNGIYVMNFKDQSRVIHAQAIDNLWWSYLTFNSADEFVPTRIFEYYKGAEPLTKKKAQKKAFKMEKEILSDDFCPVLEYGICTFDVNKTWAEIIEEAKKFAAIEIISIYEKDNWKKWYKFEISRLQEIIDY